MIKKNYLMIKGYIKMQLKVNLGNNHICYLNIRWIN